MTAKFKLNIPPKSLFMLAGCVIVLCAIGLVLLFPSQRLIPRLEQEIGRLEAELKTQEMIFPVYQQLLSQLQQTGKAIQNGPPAPEKEILTQEEMARMQIEMDELARAHSLTLNSIAPNINSLIENSEYVVVDMSLTGGFFHLRAFLGRMVTEFKALEHIEQIRLIKNEVADELTIDIKAGFLQEN